MLSACAHLPLNAESHLLKSGDSALLTAFAAAFSRQRSYFPATPSLLASHFSAGDAAWAALTANRTAATAAQTLVPLILSMVAPLRSVSNSPAERCRVSAGT